MLNLSDFTAALGFWNMMNRSVNVLQLDLKPERGAKSI